MAKVEYVDPGRADSEVRVIETDRIPIDTITLVNWTPGGGGVGDGLIVQGSGVFNATLFPSPISKQLVKALKRTGVRFEKF